LGGALFEGLFDAFQAFEVLCLKLLNLLQIIVFKGLRYFKGGRG
jgi:hypothetical protein